MKNGPTKPNWERSRKNSKRRMEKWPQSVWTIVICMMGCNSANKTALNWCVKFLKCLHTSFLVLVCDGPVCRFIHSIVCSDIGGTNIYERFYLRFFFSFLSLVSTNRFCECEQEKYTQLHERIESKTFKTELVDWCFANTLHLSLVALLLFEKGHDLNYLIKFVLSWISVLYAT